MTIDELGSLGELIAAIATVATLGYLAFQIRQTNTWQRTQAFESALGRVNDWYGLLSANDEAARIFLEGGRDFGRLGAAERTRFHMLLIHIFIPCEMMFRMGSDRLLPGASLEAVDRFITDLFRQPGVAEWWLKRGRAAVAKDWGDYVERLASTPRAADPSRTPAEPEAE